MEEEKSSAGDAIPPNCEVIEVRVTELKQLFNAIDPAPFRERDLDPKAEEFIVEWARETPGDREIALLVHLERAAGRPDEAAVLRDAVAEFFAHRAESARQRLRQHFRIGRTSLVIGLAFLAAVVALGDLVDAAVGNRRLGALLRESFLIGGWVAMWRPLEIFLYGWWPIRADIRLYRRLSAMPVRIEYVPRAEPDAWRRDWPVVPAAAEAPRPAFIAVEPSRPAAPR